MYLYNRSCYYIIYLTFSIFAERYHFADVRKMVRDRFTCI